MKSHIKLLKSGLSIVDEAWGGFYKGGSYLLIGPHKTGRTLIGLQYAMQSAKSGEVCIYFTNMRPKDLMIQAASIDFDIQNYMNQNLIIVVRVAAPTDVYQMRNPDMHLAEYMKDIVTVVNQYSPQRIIFDELTPYIGFNNLDTLRNIFLQTLETIEEKDVTSLFVVGEPATQIAQQIVDTVAQQVTATIHLQKAKSVTENKTYIGRITITPNIGHTEGQFTANYSIEPYKGVLVDFKPVLPSIETIKQEPVKTPQPSTESRFTSLASFQVPSESYSFSNLYDYDDFMLLLNNQIALYKSTGQAFNLLVFKLDPAADQSKLLTINQLQNAIRLATEKRDKICVIDNKIIVLVTSVDSKNISGLISKLQGNLPGNDVNFIKNILQYISVLNVEIDEKFENAESLMNFVLMDDNTQQNFNFFNNFNA